MYVMLLSPKMQNKFDFPLKIQHVIQSAIHKSYIFTVRQQKVKKWIGDALAYSKPGFLVKTLNQFD